MTNKKVSPLWYVKIKKMKVSKIFSAPKLKKSKGNNYKNNYNLKITKSQKKIMMPDF